MLKKWLFIVIILFFVVLQYPVQAQEPELPTRENLEDGWNQLFPGGETTCSRGTPYSFFVHPAESEKVLIHFQGGGACWNEDTCSEEDGTFQDSVPDLAEGFYEDGIFDLENDENPVADYNMVVVSYCTGDIHSGDRSIEYADNLQIEHKGYVNTMAVLDWVFANYASPSEIVVTGCSAGAYGAIYHAPAVMQQYPDVPVQQLGDSGIGVIPDDWEGLSTWGIYDGIYLDDFREVAPSVPPSQFTTALYTETANRFPDNTFAQYTTANDSVQTFFYFLQGAIGWNAGMAASQEALNELPNYYSFIAGGDAHCVLPTVGFYTYAADGVNFSTWFTALINGTLDESVTCTDCAEMSRQ